MKKEWFFVCAAASFFTAPNFVIAAPSANEICQKMISEGRGGGLSQKDCLCIHRVADAALDEDIKMLLFDSWYTGNNNMQTMELLPNPRRVKQQLGSMELSLEVNCRLGGKLR